MHIQIVNFNLNDVSSQDYENSCNEIAQAFADLPGLQSKYWLADKENNTYGGVYLWENHEAMQSYLESDLFNQVATNPVFKMSPPKTFEFWQGRPKLLAV